VEASLSSSFSHLSLWSYHNRLCLLLALVVLCRAQLALGWVGQVNRVCVEPALQPGLFSLAVPPWADAMSTSKSWYVIRHVT